MAHWFISTKYRKNTKLSLITFTVVCVVILLGAFTRLTDAGLSCPDWPNCYGFMTAPHTTSQIEDAAKLYPAHPVETKKAWTEMVHRYFAGSSGLLILLLAGTILFNRKAKDLKSKLIALALLGLLGIQVALGALTVTAKLKPIIVTSHLLTGLSILSILWWIYLEIHLQDDSFVEKKSTRAKGFLWIGLLLLVMQITLGGWVSSHYAGLACIDLPYCNNQLLPTLHWQQWGSDLITIHMLHRMGAIITGTYLLSLGLFLIRNPAFRIIGISLLILTLVQLTLGIFNILWLRPVWIAMLHHATALLLLLTLITALVKTTFMTSNRYGSLHHA
ncbi:MAG: COX15/CtaA family protein [Gammaproteobacteria bacterium]|nr:COX15/CtaA family protein [Gammaproteobacteria bacterium]